MKKSCFMSNHNKRNRPSVSLVLGRRTLFQKIGNPFPQSYHMEKRDGRTDRGHE